MVASDFWQVIPQVPVNFRGCCAPTGELCECDHAAADDPYHHDHAATRDLCGYDLAVTGEVCHHDNAATGELCHRPL